MKKTRKATQTVKALDYHRNGVSGLGFHVGIVQERDGEEVRDMLVIRFPKEADKVTGNVVCAAFDLAKLADKDIRFGHNSWRGDYYHAIMDEAINKNQQEG